MTLRMRFERFMQTAPGVETIDALLEGRKDLHGKQRADYLLLQRSIIIEQKAIEANASWRPKAFMDRLARERGYCFHGKLTTDEILRNIPDSEKFYRRMLLHLTKPIHDVVARADKQTGHTREIFGIPDAAGVVVILNEGNAIFDPDLLTWRVLEMLRETREDGTLRYPSNAAFVVIAEANSTVGADEKEERPVTVNLGPGAIAYPDLKYILKQFVRDWAMFNGLRFICREF